LYRAIDHYDDLLEESRLFKNTIDEVLTLQIFYDDMVYDRMNNDDAEIDFDFEDADFDLADEPPRVQPSNEPPTLLPTDMEVAELSDRIYGPSETGSAYGNIYTRNAPIEGMTKTHRNEIIAKGKRSRADYVGDAELNTFNEAWRDAATVIQERKIQERLQETKNKKTNKKKRKRPMGGARITKSKKQRKQRKNKSRKSSRRNQKK
jgi:hypothetical protein